MTKKNKEEKPDKKEKKDDELITLQNWTIKNNIPALLLTGFKMETGIGEQDLKPEKELDKLYNKYKNKSAFIKK